MQILECIYGDWKVLSEKQASSHDCIDCKEEEVTVPPTTAPASAPTDEAVTCDSEKEHYDNTVKDGKNYLL